MISNTMIKRALSIPPEQNITSNFHKESTSFDGLIKRQFEFTILSNMDGDHIKKAQEG